MFRNYASTCLFDVNRFRFLWTLRSPEVGAMRQSL